MALDAYSSCPCGSGKKFKWCCQPIHAQIDKAFEQEAEGQHDMALRMMEEVTAQNPANPEAWGRKSQLLYQNDKVDEAENILQKALDINPNYPFGYLLRGLFRQHEGEVAGRTGLELDVICPWRDSMRACRCGLGLSLVALLSAANTATQAADKVEVKVVKYAALGDTIKQLKGKVVVVDFWADY